MLYTTILNNNRDFLALYNKGSCIVSKNAVVYFRRNNRNINRFGITAGKKVGKAYQRNRAKRIIRQAYRDNELLMPIGIDIVIVARSGASKSKSDDISAFLRDVAVPKIHKVLQK